MARSSAGSSRRRWGFAPPARSTPSLAHRFAGALRSDGSVTVFARLLAAIAFLLPAAAARAQGDPPVGVRAAGMAGAFTAVADDATAAVWNPAGLASGSYFSVAIDGSRFDRQSAFFAGFGSPPLALTYYRAATAEVSNGRNMLVTHNFGVSLVQSVGNTGLAAGATLKLVHGVRSGGGVPSTSADAFDADVGVMFSGGLGQIGFTVRNVAESFDLGRRVRAGASVRVNDRTTVDGDVEFTKAATASGFWRDAAIGVETHAAEHVWLRSGVHWNTAGVGGEAGSAGQPGAGAAPIAAFGASYAIRGALMADAQASVGSAGGNRGWGVGLRFMF